MEIELDSHIPLTTRTCSHVKEPSVPSPCSWAPDQQEVPGSNVSVPFASIKYFALLIFHALVYYNSYRPQIKVIQRQRHLQATMDPAGQFMSMKWQLASSCHCGVLPQADWQNSALSYLHTICCLNGGATCRHTSTSYIYKGNKCFCIVTPGWNNKTLICAPYGRKPASHYITSSTLSSTVIVKSDVTSLACIKTGTPCIVDECNGIICVIRSMNFLYWGQKLHLSLPWMH